MPNPKYTHQLISFETLICDVSSSSVPEVERLPTLMEHQNAAEQ
jgi:hypothetical protein